MKKAMKRLLSVCLVLLLVLGSAPLAGLAGMLTLRASAKTITQNKQGDIFEFGWYPQSKVTDSSILSQLNAKAPAWESWTSYGYYSGSGWNDGSMTAKDYMRYVDITLNGTKYRAVRFTDYRPSITYNTSSATNAYQDDNGYTTNAVYWFKYEPLQWRVLDPAKGLVLCETIIDSQAYQSYCVSYNKEWMGDAAKTHYANNYSESDIRRWLNRDFYNTAFSAAQQSIIQYTELDNRTAYSVYNAKSTMDKIFLLSSVDAENAAYCFTDVVTRTAKGTDYAKCQGLFVDESECSEWFLRSGGSRSYSAYQVLNTGSIFSGGPVYIAYEGIRPALQLDPKSEMVSSDVSETCSSRRFGTTDTITKYQLNEIVAFGSYPQSKVTDGTLISALNACASGWKSYGYYSGSGTTWDDGSGQPSDYMRYCDVELNGKYYRGVTFDTYRSDRTNCKSTTSAEDADQADNGYTYGNTYWFRYEPLQWRVLDPATGLVLCETIIDSQPYNNYVLHENSAYWGDSAKTHYANNYAESSLRKWLNEDFYNTAFNDSEKLLIEAKERENKAYSTSCSGYDSASTTDNITLLTYQDILNTSYGFSSSQDKQDINRRAFGSDYAKCQGLFTSPDFTDVHKNKCSIWWLRSAGNYSGYTFRVWPAGYAYSSYVSYTDAGVRPAFNFNLSSEIVQSDMRKKEEPTAADFTFTAGNYEYDGTAKTATVSVKQGIEGMGAITVQYYSEDTLLPSAPTNVGIYTIRLNVEEGTNYKAKNDITDVAWTLTITPRQLTVSGTKVKDKIYDGTCDANVSLGTVSGIVQGEQELTVSVDTGMFDDSGAGEDKNVTVRYIVSGASVGNYYPPKDDTLTATITPAEVVTEAVSAGPITYGQTLSESALTGTAKWNGTQVKGTFRFKNPSVKPTVAESKGTQYEVVFTPDATETNFAETEGRVQVQVLPVSTVLTITAGSASKKYDGTSLTHNAYLYTSNVLLDGDLLTATVSGTITDAGSVSNTVTSYKVMNGQKDVTDCYTIKTADGTLTVTKRDVTLTSASAEKQYDSTPLSNVGTVAVSGDGFADGEGAAFTITGAQKDAGMTENTFDYVLNNGTKENNYNITVDFGTLTVTKRNVTLTSASATKKNDGTPLTDDTVTIAGEGFADEEGATFTVTGTQTAVGSTENAFTYQLNAGTKAENYNISTVFGTLTVILNDKEKFALFVQETVQSLKDYQQTNESWIVDKIIEKAIEVIEETAYDTTKTYEENQTVIENLEANAMNKVSRYLEIIENCPFLRVLTHSFGSFSDVLLFVVTFAAFGVLIGIIF